MKIADAVKHSHMNQLVEQFNAMPWEQPTYYKAWLSQSYYYTSYSTRLLALAASWTSNQEQSYYRRSLTHIREEQGHEQIAISDLKKMGGEIEQFQELGVTRALWECQYSKTLKNPLVLLGYILALETFAVRAFPEFYSVMKAKYQPEALRFVKVHAEEDPGHVDEAIAQIGQCTSADQLEIMANFKQTCELYRLMLSEIKATWKD